MSPPTPSPPTPSPPTIGPVNLDTARWPDIAPGRVTVAVPVGAFEQHGPHLPLDTDTRIASAVATALSGAPALSGVSALSGAPNPADVAVAPPVAYGASGEHEGFAGTVSIGAEVMESLLVEYGRSVCRWAARVVFVNGHGGNAHALVKAVALLRYEGRDAAWLPCAVPGGDAHGGDTETSLLLHLAPEVVAMDRAEVGSTESIVTLLPRLREGGIVAVSANGVLGDPTAASAERGARMFADLVERATAQVARWQPDAEGRLR